MKSLRERRKEARLSLLTKCLAEGIGHSFNYNLEKAHNTRQEANICTPYIKSNDAFYFSFWPRTVRDLQGCQLPDFSLRSQTFCYTADFSTTFLYMLKTNTFLHIPSQNHQQAP